MLINHCHVSPKGFGGAQRIIYGLDYPWNPKNLDALRCDVEWVRSWDISDEDKERILGGNLETLIQR